MSWFLHWNRFGEIKHYTTCSQKDPLQWMGAVRMRVQTIITSNPHQSLVMQKALCLCQTNPSLRCNFKPLLLAIINNPIINNNSSSSEKVIFLLSSRIKNHWHICLELFSLVNGAWSLHISLLIQTRQILYLRKQRTHIKLEVKIPNLGTP